MRKFNIDAEIVFTNVYTLSAKYRNMPFGLGSFSHFTAHKNYYAERADLDEYILLYTISGEGELYYQDNVYKIQKNQVIFLDGGIHHLYQTVGDCDWDFYFMVVSGGGVKYYYDFLFSNGFYVLDFFDSIIFEKIIHTLRYMDEHRSQQFELLAGNQIHVLLTQLSLLNSGVNDFDLTEATEYVENHIEKKITVNELAEVCRMSKYHFIRKFKSVYAETPHEFITRIKVNRAKAFLTQSMKSVAEIGLSVGYADTTTFIRAFRMVTGTTPNQYRKRMVFGEGNPE